MRRHPGSAYAFAAIAALSLAACKPATPPETAAPAATPAATDTAAPAAPAAPPAATEAPAFVGKVWQVKDSSSVAPGATYVFLADGTLIIESSGSTPMRGKWTYENGALVMIEEGQSYPTDILKLDAGEFRIRSHNPGEPVEILLIPAPDQTLPKAQP